MMCFCPNCRWARRTQPRTRKALIALDSSEDSSYAEININDDQVAFLNRLADIIMESAEARGWGGCPTMEVKVQS